MATAQPDRAARRHTQNTGLPRKNLLGVPWRVAFALRADGWILRQAIIWHKPNAIPESVTDRTSCTYEYLFLLTTHARYHFDLDQPPAVLAFHTGQQPKDKITGGPTRLRAGEPSRYRTEQALEHRLPPRQVYAIDHGHRRVY